jgi:hypothetical protein
VISLNCIKELTFENIDFSEVNIFSILAEHAPNLISIKIVNGGL